MKRSFKKITQKGWPRSLEFWRLRDWYLLLVSSESRPGADSVAGPQPWDSRIKKELAVVLLTVEQRSTFPARRASQKGVGLGPCQGRLSGELIPLWEINPWKWSGSQKQSARGEALYEATKLESEVENPQKPAKAHRERKRVLQTLQWHKDTISRSQLWQQLISRRGCGVEKKGRVAKVTAAPSPLHASSAKAGARWGGRRKFNSLAVWIFYCPYIKVAWL